MVIVFNVNGQVINPARKYEVYSGIRNYLKAVFQFSDEWDGIYKTALFTGPDKVTYKMLLDDNGECIVPWEVVKDPGFTVSVYGGDLMTANIVEIPVFKSGYAEGVDPSEPTPDIYNQLVETVQAERRLALQAAEAANAAASNANVVADNINAAEQTRQAAENTRVSAENTRATAEQARVIAENTRQTNENNRVAAEQNRVDAENARVTAEQGRIEAEYQRTEAENLRVQAENQRQASFAQFESRITTLESGKADKADIYLKQEVDAAFAQTNLRVAEIGKDLSDYKAVLSQLNPNQEAKQTISGYYIVRLPVNAANGHMDVAVGGNTEIDEDGMQHTVSAMRIVSESEDETQRTELYIPDYGELRSVPNGTADEISGGQLIQRVKTIAITANDIRGLGTAGVNVDWVVISKPTDYIGYGTSAYATGTFTFGNYTEKRISTLDLPENINCISSFGPGVFYLVIPKGTYANLNAAKTALAGTKLTYQLAEPIITPINVSGTLLSYPKGTVYAEPVLPVAGIYTANGISVTNTDFPIESIERIYKIDFAAGVETPIDVSKVVVAGNGLGFTHPDLADGDIVFFTYYYSNTGTQPKISATYFDSRYVLKDTVTGKFYKKVETVQNGQLVTQLVEVS